MYEQKMIDVSGLEYTNEEFEALKTRVDQHPLSITTTGDYIPWLQQIGNGERIALHPEISVPALFLRTGWKQTDSGWLPPEYWVVHKKFHAEILVKQDRKLISKLYKGHVYAGIKPDQFVMLTPGSIATYGGHMDLYNQKIHKLVSAELTDTMIEVAYIKAPKKEYTHRVLKEVEKPVWPEFLNEGWVLRKLAENYLVDSFDHRVVKRILEE
ncbi:MAG: hypothetical protein HQL54_12940 [Magnetococcales bacterium]|nr:hypothetical protein [Magnetococcales bacterium]